MQAEATLSLLLSTYNKLRSRGASATLVSSSHRADMKTTLSVKAPSTSHQASPPSAPPPRATPPHHAPTTLSSSLPTTVSSSLPNLATSLSSITITRPFHVLEAANQEEEEEDLKVLYFFKYICPYHFT